MTSGGRVGILLTMSEIRSAWERVALAGRELGSGPAAVVKRFPDVVEDLREIGVRGKYVESIALGIIVGRVRSGDPKAEEVLREIRRDWLVRR